MPPRRCQIELNTWVTVTPEQGNTRGKKLSSNTPALVSGVDEAAKTVSVIYPCELVLRMGFVGSPLKRHTCVPFNRVKRVPPSKDAARLAKMQELLMFAVREAAAEARKLRQAVSEDVNFLPETRVQQWVQGFKGDLKSCRDGAPATMFDVRGDVKTQDDVLQANEEVASEDTSEVIAPTEMLEHGTNEKDTSGREDVEATLVKFAEAPCTPQNRVLESGDDSRGSVDKEPLRRNVVERPMSRSRSPPRSKISAMKAPRRVAARSAKVERSLKSTDLQSLKFLAVRAAAAAFKGRDQMPRDELVNAMEGVCKGWEVESVQSEWLVQQLDQWGKVFIADSLVFTLC